MPISSTTRKAGPFIGNDTASVFPFAFKVFSTDDVVVVRADAIVQATLVQDSDYTVSLNEDQDDNPGGTVTLIDSTEDPAIPEPLASGYTLVIASGVDELQQTDLTNQGGFYPEVITDALDKLTALIQQLHERLDRTVTFPISDPSLQTEFPTAATRANKFLYFGSDGSPTVATGVPGLAAMVFFAGALTGTVNGVNKVFTLTNNGSPLAGVPLLLTVWQNYPLVPDVGYTLGPGAGQITFTDAPQEGDTLYAQGAYQA